MLADCGACSGRGYVVLYTRKVDGLLVEETGPCLLCAEPVRNVDGTRLYIDPKRSSQ